MGAPVRARFSRSITRRTFLGAAAAAGGGLLAAPVIAACQPAGTTSATPSGTRGVSSGAMTIRVWGFGLDDARAKARLELFTKSYPNIKVEPTGGALSTQQLLTSVASGDPPEVVHVSRDTIGSWAGRNAIQSISDLVQQDKFDTSEFYEAAFDQVKYKGEVYGVPQFGHVELLWMNTDVLAEQGIALPTIDPGNWDQLLSLGDKLHRQDGAKVVRTGFDTKTYDGRLWQWAWAQGLDLINADGLARFNDPKVVEALTWTKEVVDRQGGERARAAFSQTQNFFSPQNPVLIGQTAMTMYESFLGGTLRVAPNAPVRAILPRKRGSTDPLTTMYGSALAIPRGIKDDKRDGAWAFMKSMSSSQGWIAAEKAELAAREAKSPPEKYIWTISGNKKADQEIWNSIYKPVGPAFDETVKLFPQAVAAAKFRYAGPTAADINDEMTRQVNDALQGAKSPKDAMDALQKFAETSVADFKKGPGNK